MKKIVLLLIVACAPVEAQHWPDAADHDAGPLDVTIVDAPTEDARLPDADPPDSAVPDALTCTPEIYNGGTSCAMCATVEPSACPACWLYLQDGAVVAFEAACCAQPCCTAIGWSPC